MRRDKCVEEQISGYLCYLMCQRERHPPWIITPQYSAPGRAYDFRGKIACKCWQTHDMVNLIASWQSNYYQIAHQMVRYISIWNPPFWTPGSAYYSKNVSQSLCIYVITWCISVAVRKTVSYSYNTSASWSSPKWLARPIGNRTSQFPMPWSRPW